MAQVVWDWDSRLWAACVRAVRRIAESTSVDSRGLKGSDEAGRSYGPSWREIGMAERVLAKLEKSGCEGVFHVTMAQMDFLHNALDGDNPDEANFSMLLVAARQDADAKVPLDERIRRAQERLAALRTGESLREV